MNRRTFLSFSGTAAAAFAAGLTPAASAAEKPAAFVPPTKDHPLYLNFNENPMGMSRKAVEAAAKGCAVGNRYADARFMELKAACGAYVGAKPENVLVTHGSSEAIRAAIEAYASPDTRLFVPELTYSDSADVAGRNGVPVVSVKMLPDWTVDIPAMRQAVEKWYGFSIIYCPNPNNPTASICDCKALTDWIRSKPADTVFVIDEAYREFVTDSSFVSAETLVAEGLDNVIVLKTFSKIFAMAGMRLGFAYAQPKVINRLRDRVAYEEMMNAPAIEAALSELSDKEFLKASRDSNAESRKILSAAFDELKLHYIPSQANFIFVDLKAPLKPFADRMRAENIVVGRPFPPADTWCRISFGTPDETKYLVGKLKEFRAKGWV
ncbi:MAG: Aminotran-1-2 domain-containing protein [Burkholderia sp.]|jgi:histidinol-phosphate aminotransferase